ncbi:MAG: signal recognition particle-docking protein FtsY [Nitrosomonadaceae bacterium]
MLSFFKSKNDSAPAETLTTNWAANVRRGLSRTRENLSKQLSNVLGGGKIDEAIYEELETVLLTADIGINATTWLLDTLRKRVKQDGLTDATQLKGALKEALIALLAPLARPLDTSTEKPFIIMLAGVNGSGKTTSIGKLTHYFRSQEKSVLLAAGDTFRAAAREQLMTWGERNNVSVISQKNSDQQKGDPAAVIFDAINAAKARSIDILLADTAGRLATQLHLMEEIKKVKRVIAKANPGAPHEVLLVLDANTGQNAVSQVQAFDDALSVTGLILTKLDGTPKGGVIAAIARQRQQNPIPLRFIGVGEGMEDLRPFDAREFVDALFD